MLDVDDNGWDLSLLANIVVDVSIVFLFIFDPAVTNDDVVVVGYPHVPIVICSSFDDDGDICVLIDKLSPFEWILSVFIDCVDAVVGQMSEDEPNINGDCRVIKLSVNCRCRSKNSASKSSLRFHFDDLSYIPG